MLWKKSQKASSTHAEELLSFGHIFLPKSCKLKNTITVKKKNGSTVCWVNQTGVSLMCPFLFICVFLIWVCGICISEGCALASFPMLEGVWRVCVGVCEIHLCAAASSLAVPSSCASVLFILCFPWSYCRWFHSSDFKHDETTTANRLWGFNYCLFSCGIIKGSYNVFGWLWTHPSLEQPAPQGWGRWASCFWQGSGNTAATDPSARLGRRLGHGSDSERGLAKAQRYWDPTARCRPG